MLQTFCNTTSCQTDVANNEKFSKDSLMSFLSVQDKLIKAIDQLKKEYNREKELRFKIEAKYEYNDYVHFSHYYSRLDILLHNTKLCLAMYFC